jgi:hypothetical protein
MFSIFKKTLNHLKIKDRTYTKQISVARISNASLLNSTFLAMFANILEKRDFDWGGGVKWLSGGTTVGQLGGFDPPPPPPPPNYIVKKGPVSISQTIGP